MPDERRPGLARLAPVLLPLLLLVLVVALNPALRAPANWDRIGRSWAGVALLAVALTPIIITGGIDLSVGSVVGASAVFAGFLAQGLGLPLGAALAGGVLLGLVCGAVNGALVLAGINPLVVTLATLGVFRGLAYGLSDPRAEYRFPPVLRQWWNDSLLGLPHPVWLVAAGFGLFYVLLHHTWMGRMLYALGDNARAARFAAVPVRALTFGLYALSGLVAGVVGQCEVSQFTSAPATQGENLELRAVACVVLGGARITGGSGHLAGTLLGTLTLAAVIEGLVGVPGRWRPLVTGVLLVTVAVVNEGLARWGRRTRPFV